MSNGVVIYRGASQLDGAPIIAVATGFRLNSSNRKVGKEPIETWILRADMKPYQAILTGADASICGSCSYRGTTDGYKVTDRKCYVLVHFAPRSVWSRYHSQPETPLSELTQLFRGRGIRLGAYGDPAAVPSRIWQQVTEQAAFWTGYTHQWRTCDPVFARWCMASCDSLADQRAARMLGYRTFRVTTQDARRERQPDEIVCPASVEMGYRTTCERCRVCGGTSGRVSYDVVITIHGGAGRKARTNRSATMELVHEPASPTTSVGAPGPVTH